MLDDLHQDTSNFTPFTPKFTPKYFFICQVMQGYAIVRIAQNVVKIRYADLCKYMRETVFTQLRNHPKSLQTQ